MTKAQSVLGSQRVVDPFPTQTAGDGPVCRACNFVNATGADQCARPTCRKVLAGNGLATRDGLHATSLAHALAEEREAFVDASLADDGGPGEVPTRRRSLHQYRGRLHVHIAQLSGAIERHGLFDGRGRLRSLWLQRLEGLIDRARAIDTTLGLARRSKTVASVSEIIREYARREDPS